MVYPRRTYIPINQIHSLPMLASHSPTFPDTIGVDAVPPRVEGTDAVLPRDLEATGQAIATPPVVCELCYKGFRCKEDLVDHCKCMHGNFVEYREHVFWKAQEHGLHPQAWWQRRSILSAHAFFHRFSIPGSHVNDYCRSFDKAVPRRMEACAICAVKDWIEHRTRMYLFAEPDGRRSRIFQESDGQDHEEIQGIQCYETEESNNSTDEPPPDASHFYHTKKDCLCIAKPDKVDKILGVQHYIAAWPKIPIEELHASSVQHPRHPSMRWLLHSRRVAKHTAQPNNSAQPDNAAVWQEAEHGVRPPVHAPRCAGVGKEDEAVWVCFHCARCLCQQHPEMPDLALANWMWLGRVYHLYIETSRLPCAYSSDWDGL